MQNDKFRPLTVQRIEIGLDAKGDIVGWRHRIVNETYLGRVLPPPVFKAIGMHDVVSGGGGDMSYDVANHRVEWVRASRGVDVGAWRGIAAGYTKFAIETLVDELAAAKNMDPVAYRLACSRTIRAPRRWSRRSPKWPSGARSGRAGRWASPIPTRCTAIRGGGGDLARREVRRDQGPSRLGRGRCRCRRAAEEHRGADEERHDLRPRRRAPGADPHQGWRRAGAQLRQLQGHAHVRRAADGCEGDLHCRRAVRHRRGRRSGRSRPRSPTP